MCPPIGGQVPTLVHALTGRLSWRVTLRLLKASDAGGYSIATRTSRPGTSFYLILQARRATITLILSVPPPRKAA